MALFSFLERERSRKGTIGWKEDALDAKVRIIGGIRY